MYATTAQAKKNSVVAKSPLRNGPGERKIGSRERARKSVVSENKIHAARKNGALRSVRNAMAIHARTKKN